MRDVTKNRIGREQLLVAGVAGGLARELVGALHDRLDHRRACVRRDAKRDPVAHNGEIGPTHGEVAESGASSRNAFTFLSS